LKRGNINKNKVESLADRILVTRLPGLAVKIKSYGLRVTGLGLLKEVGAHCIRPSID